MAKQILIKPPADTDGVEVGHVAIAAIDGAFSLSSLVQIGNDPLKIGEAILAMLAEPAGE